VENVSGKSLFAVLNLLLAHLQSMSIQIRFLDLSAHNEAIAVSLRNSFESALILYRGFSYLPFLSTSLCRLRRDESKSG
jgi:hypothetical protein